MVEPNLGLSYHGEKNMIRGGNYIGADKLTNANPVQSSVHISSALECKWGMSNREKASYPYAFPRDVV